MYLNKYKDSDKVRVCKNNVCVEARGENAKLLVAGVFLFFVCMGIAVIASANK